MGKGGGSSGGSSGPTATTASPWGPSEPYLKEYMNLINSLVTGQGGANTSNPSLTGGQVPQQSVAGLDPAEMAGLQSELTAAGQQGQLANTNASTAEAILGGSNMNATMNPYLNSYYQAALQPMANTYAATTAPSEMSQAALSGAFGGSSDAEARALNQYNFGNNEATLGANIYEPAYQADYLAGLGQQTSVLGMEPSLMSGLTQPGETTLGAGAITQEQQQNQLNTQYQNQYSQFMWPYQQAQYLGSGLGLPAGSGGATVSYPSSSGGGSGDKKQGTISDVMGAASIAAMMFA